MDSATLFDADISQHYLETSLAGENQEIDCSRVMDEMFVKDGGETYTYPGAVILPHLHQNRILFWCPWSALSWRRRLELVS